MKQLLEIPRPLKNGFIIWEHTLKSVVAFVGTFAMLFFGPMMLGSRHRVNDVDDRLAVKFVLYILENPGVHIGLSVLAVLLTNVYLLRKNRKMRYVVGIALDEEIISFELTNLYYSKKSRIELPLSDFEFSIETKVSEINEKKRKIIFNNKMNQSNIGFIDPDHLFWSDHLIKIRNVIKELGEYRRK